MPGCGHTVNVHLTWEKAAIHLVALLFYILNSKHKPAQQELRQKDPPELHSKTASPKDKHSLQCCPQQCTKLTVAPYFSPNYTTSSGAASHFGFNLHFCNG